MSEALRTLGSQLLRSGHLFARVVRFGIIGGLAGVVYAAVTTLLFKGAGIAPVAASIGGYCISVPVSFLCHRGFSFRSQGHWTVEALRFAVAQVLNITVTALAMQGAVAYLGVSFVWGMVAAVVLVPVANFLLMNFWVFRSRQARSPIGA